MSPEMNSTNEIPQIVKEFLFQKPGIHGFGILDSSNFRVFIEKSAEIESLKSELYKLCPNFFNKMSLKIVSDKIKIQNYVEQGDKIYLNKKTDDTQFSYATVGALLKDDGKDKVYGLTCHHALTQENQHVYTLSPDTSKLSKVGECIYSDKKPLHDFAVFQIDKDKERHCNTTFLNRMEDPCNVNIQQGLIPSNAVVHKKGATTNFTDGRILSSEFYYKLFGDEQKMFPVSFLVSSLDPGDHPFSEQGDSGSVVFQHDSSPDQTSVSALGLVTGGINDVRDDSSTEALNATVCLRLNTALFSPFRKEAIKLEIRRLFLTSSISDESQKPGDI
ncbi:uncharacterized protein LOC134246950 [Saccostrea cucullata]|uniref:uncharacterized protein LOC134246950 n=1 Tax=Saccostrea cuccullata TaxID=36930 RepID=UPI002ED67D49